MVELNVHAQIIIWHCGIIYTGSGVRPRMRLMKRKHLKEGGKIWRENNERCIRFVLFAYLRSLIF